MSHHEEVSALLRGHGCRVTPQRLLILDIVRQRREHLTAEEIHAQVVDRFPGVDLSTVYRTLELLCNLGLVGQTTLGPGAVYYEWTDDPEHHHLVCLGCGCVLHVGDEALAGVRCQLEQDCGFRAIQTRLTVFGRCRTCR